MKKIRNSSEVIFRGKKSLYNTKHSRKKCKFRKKDQFFVVAIFSEKEKKHDFLANQLGQSRIFVDAK